MSSTPVGATPLRTARRTTAQARAAGTAETGTARTGTTDRTATATQIARARSLPAVDTSGPSSVPVPLLVLGGLSLALLAAGGLGYVSRRRQAAHADDVGSDDTLV